MAEFFESVAGKITFAVFITVISVALLALNYKWFTKRFFDIIFSLAAIIITSPVALILFIAEKMHLSKHNDYQGVLTVEWIIGKKGKPRKVHEFSYRNALTGEVDDFGEKIRPFARLAWLYDVFSGSLSFIGPMPMYVKFEKLISDEDYTRHNVRPGLINPLVVRGKNETRSYEKMFKADNIYVRKHSLFGDLRIFIVWFFVLLRGAGENRIGVAEQKDYASYLFENGVISEEDYQSVNEEEEKQLRRMRKRKELEKKMANKR